MKCMSCGADIPPAFVNAIENNLCPGCGGAIMNEQSQELMKDLAEAMEKMPNDPQGLAGWLLTHYQLNKIGDGAPTEHFHRQGGASGPYDESKLKIAESPTNEFFKRTGQSSQMAQTQATLNKMKRQKDNRFAELAKNIQSVEDTDPYGMGSQNSEELAHEDVNSSDLEAFQEMQSEGVNPFSEMGTVQPGVVTLDNNSQEDLLEGERELMASAEGRVVLNNNRIRKLKAQEMLESGGADRSLGGFSRSS